MLNNLLDKPFLKFVLTGGLNTAFGYTVFALFSFITDNSTLSVILANVVGILFNFKTYGRFVFKSKDNSRIFRFCFVYAFITFMQIFLLKLLGFFGIANPYLAGAIITLPVAALSFVLMRKFVFHQPLIPTKE